MRPVLVALVLLLAAAPAAEAVSLSGLTISKRIKGGEVRGAVFADPAGLTPDVVVRKGRKKIGSGTITTAGGSTSYAIKLKKSALRKKRFSVSVTISASETGAVATISGTQRVHKG